VAARPIGFVYFLAGLEVGIALIGAIVFLGLNALQGWGHRMTNQSKRGRHSNPVSWTFLRASTQVTGNPTSGVCHRLNA